MKRAQETNLLKKNEIVKVEQNNGVRNVYIKVLKSLFK